MTNPVPADLVFPPTEPLTALQEHARRLCAHFGWDAASDEKTFLLFIEEIGELAKAMRKHDRLFVETGKDEDSAAIRENMADEFADVFSYLLDLACRYDIDIGAAYCKKMTENFTRKWK